MATVTDVSSVIEQARKEVYEENAKIAVSALKAKYKQRDSAKQVLSNIEREIGDLEASIRDGSFVK